MIALGAFDWHVGWVCGLCCLALIVDIVFECFLLYCFIWVCVFFDSLDLLFTGVMLWCGLGFVASVGLLLIDWWCLVFVCFFCVYVFVMFVLLVDLCLICAIACVVAGL